ncbi:MAG: YcgL domain-containing protein [Pseudomonadota bacterium]
MPDSTPCYIYRSKKRVEMYLFLAEEDDFESVPEEVRNGLGQLEKAMELELTPESKLARSQPEEVIRNLKERGFHIQMPPPNPLI